MAHIEKEFDEIECQNAWQSTFRKLANEHGVLTLGKTNSDALLSSNRPLNRFRDVLPYDDTRVRLQRGDNDYINANRVEVPWANRTYILTQGPLRTTSNHFWQMVWEQNTRVIVMLTRLVEKGSDKCWLYYPDYENDSELTFDDVDLKVTFVAEKNFHFYTQRKFELVDLRTGEARSIIHWSDFDWPDHGAPRAPEPFLQLLCDVRYSGAFDPVYGPPVLHCSAGIGRSGTFVLVDSILKMLAISTDPETISLTQVLAHIRMQRHGLIQTFEQLRFSYMAVVAGIKELEKLEESESSFHENESNASSGSENNDDDDDDEDNSKLLKSLDDIRANLQKHSNADEYDPIPTVASKSTDRDVETSLRLRDERLKRTETIQKKVDEIKAKMNHARSNSPSMVTGHDSFNARVQNLIAIYRRPLIIGLTTILAGSILLYEFFRKK